MRRTTILALFLLVGPGLAPAASPFGALFDSRSARIQVRVLDDQGQPVDKASIGIGVTGGGDAGIARGATDTNGSFAARLRMVGSLYLRAEKPGHYRTAGELWRGPVEGEKVPATNLHTIVLKRIIHPAPMIDREVSLILPALDAPCGFDLLAGDWVAPHGAGTVADCRIIGWKDVKDPRNWDVRCQLHFTNANGVVAFRAPGLASLAAKSDLIPPQAAPESGYVQFHEFRHSFHTGQGSSESAGNEDHLVFRVRTETNAEGRVVSARVGWIEGALRLDGRNTDTMWMGFKYHLNPDPTSRSLEPQRP
jgi:hypothetical protein